MSKRRARKFLLPRDWGNRLTLAETDEILAHWVAQVKYWQWQEMMDTVSADRHVRLTESRVRLWTSVRDRKRNGRPCQDLLCLVK